MSKYPLQATLKCRKQDISAINVIFSRKYGPNCISEKDATFPIDIGLLELLQKIADNFNGTKIKLQKRKGIRGWRRLADKVRNKFDKPDYKPGGRKAEVTLEL